MDLRVSQCQRMLELSPVGMVFVSSHGVLREANGHFWEMTGIDRGRSQWEMSWLESLDEGSVAVMENCWKCLVNELQPWSGELLAEDMRGGGVHDALCCRRGSRQPQRCRRARQNVGPLHGLT